MARTAVGTSRSLRRSNAKQELAPCHLNSEMQHRLSSLGGERRRSQRCTCQCDVRLSCSGELSARSKSVGRTYANLQSTVAHFVMCWTVPKMSLRGRVTAGAVFRRFVATRLVDYIESSIKLCDGAASDLIRLCGRWDRESTCSTTVRCYHHCDSLAVGTHLHHKARVRMPSAL